MTNATTASETGWIDKVTQIAEPLSLVLLAVPFGSMVLWVLASTFLAGDYFFFFPTAMFLFLPTGMFAAIIQIIRRGRKRPAGTFSRFLFGFSMFTIVIGVLACMAIFVVTS